MEFKFGSGVIMLPPLHISILAIIIIFFLVRWSKQLETRRFTVFIYFIISTFITPIYSRTTNEGDFQLWFPLGFVLIFFYLYRSERYHSSKMKASLLGLSIAIYQLIRHYIS